MNISVIQIGNTKLIRLSKALIEKYNINDNVELILEKGYIIIKPKSIPRKGWAKSFKKMHENGDDKLIIPDVLIDEHF
jgi:antitoxin MazE